MAKRGYHHGNLREALMKSALELIEEAEPFHFTLRQAAQRAGVAASAPYRHFENKAALMTALAEEGAATLFGMMAEEMDGVESPQEQFRSMGIAFVKFAMAHPGYFRVLHMPEKARPEASESLSMSMQANAQMLSGLFGAMDASGEVAPGAPLLQFLAAQALTYGLARMFVDGQLAHLGLGLEHVEPLTRALTDVFGHGLAPRGGDEPLESSLSDEERETLLTKLQPLFGEAGL